MMKVKKINIKIKDYDTTKRRMADGPIKGREYLHIPIARRKEGGQGMTYTYTMFEAINRFGAEIVKAIGNMERQQVTLQVGGGNSFDEEYRTDYVPVDGGNLRGAFFCPKNGAPTKEYFEFMED